MVPLDRARPRLLLAALLALLVPARAALAAWPNSLTQPLVIASGAGPQLATGSVADGNGGFFVVWADYHIGNYEDYAQHYDASGSPLWTPGGVALATGASPVRGPASVVLDGSGGIVASWGEQFSVVGIRAQRLNAAGLPQWGVAGVRVATQSADVSGYVMTPDGAGGAFFAWEYNYMSTDHDVYAQHLNSLGTLLLGAGGVPVASNTSMQSMVTAAPDEAGGVWILWRDNSVAISDVYAQHLNAAGTPQFAVGGINPEDFVPGDLEGLKVVEDGFGGVIATFALNPYGDFDVEATHVYPDGSHASTVCTLYASGNQANPAIAADGNGGAFIAWTDDHADSRLDIYGTHITSYGAISPGWIDSGSPIATGVNIYQTYPSLCADGQGGGIVSWTEGGPGIEQIRAARFRADGTLAPGWVAGGNPIMTDPVPNGSQILVPTGTGGAFVAWTSGFSTDVNAVAQRIDAFGQVGSPEPHLSGVRDVANDQGGSVRVTWDRSALDTGLNTTVQGYQVWRQVPASAALAALRSGAARLLSADEDAARRAGGRRFRTTRDGVTPIYWEYAGGVPAQKFAGYSLTAATTSDSVAGSNPRTTFLVQAVGSFYSPGPVSPETWWDSAPDSGYSVDNLPPSLPTGFAATWTPPGTSLHWNANPEPDLGTYRLYRGGSASFVPSPANRVATPTQTWFVDAGASPSFYRLSAVDIHGNESGSVLVQPAGTAGATTDLPSEIALVRTASNPAFGSVSMRVDLPREERVEVGVYDAGGRRVSVLERGTLAAGRWPLLWRGVDDAGAAAPTGLYWLRMQAAGRTWSERVTLLR